MLRDAMSAWSEEDHMTHGQSILAMSLVEVGKPLILSHPPQLQDFLGTTLRAADPTGKGRITTYTIGDRVER